MSKYSYIPLIIGLIAVCAICCLAISGSFSTTLREGFFDPDIKTSGVLGMGRKAPDVSPARWKGQPNISDLGTPISSNPKASGNYTLTSEQCPAKPRPKNLGPTGCSQIRGDTQGGRADGGQCKPIWDPNVTTEWTYHAARTPTNPPYSGNDSDKYPGPEYWSRPGHAPVLKKPLGWDEPPNPPSWCDYNPAPSINGGKPLCVIENQCSKGNLCDLETQRCATPDSNFILVETQTQCPLKPAPARNGGAGGPDNQPAAPCGGDTWNSGCPTMCQAPGYFGWDSGGKACHLMYVNTPGGKMTALDDIHGAFCTNANSNGLPQKCAFRQSCPSGQLCDMSKNKCMALCKEGDETCKSDAMGPPTPAGMWESSN